MDLFAVGLKLRAEGAAAAKTAVDSLRNSIKGVKSETDALGTNSAVSFKRFAANAIAAAGGIAILTGALKKVTTESVAAQDAEAQLVASLESTNYAAGQTKESLLEMAAELQRTTRYGDDAVIAMQSVLLTFTKIGGDVFPKATLAIADMSSKLGGDLKSTALQVGKALNDPVKGVNMLSRAGVQFSDSQKAMIESLVATNKHAEAQSVILKELETQFGGSAKAARNTLGGALEALSNAWGDAFEVSRENSAGIIAAIESLTAVIPKIRDVINDTFQAWRFIWVDMQISTTLAVEKIKVVIDDVVNAFKNMGRILTLQEPVVSDARKNYENLKVTLEEWRDAEYQAIVGVNAKTVAVRTLTAAVEQLSSATEQAKSISLSSMGSAASGFTPGTSGVQSDLANLTASVTASVRQATVAAKVAAAEMQIELRETFASTIGNSLVDGFSAGIAEAVATGNIGAGFKALTSTLLGGLGRAMVEFGKASLLASTFMEKIKTSLASFLPGGAIVASLAMIAVGSALSGAAGAAFGGGRGAGALGIGSAGQPIPGSSSSSPATQIVFGATSAGTAAGMQPRQANTFIVIGPEDPTAQRTIEELLRKSNARGVL